MLDLTGTRREHLFHLLGFVGIMSGVTGREAEAARLPLPGIDVWSLDGELKKLSDFYGDPLLLHTYSAGCSPCKEGFPILNDLISSIKVLGLFCGWGRSFHTDKTSWLKETEAHKMNFPSVLVANNGEEELAQFRKEYIAKGDGGYPAYFVLDSSGVCRHYQTGGLTFQDNLPTLEKAIRN